MFVVNRTRVGTYVENDSMCDLATESRSISMVLLHTVLVPLLYEVEIQIAPLGLITVSQRLLRSKYAGDSSYLFKSK
jgi:hypothetical protein